MDPAVRLQLLQQLGEQSRACTIATMQTKAVIMAALLVLALSELWLGVTRWRAGRCQSYQCVAYVDMYAVPQPCRTRTGLLRAIPTYMHTVAPQAVAGV